MPQKTICFAGKQGARIVIGQTGGAWGSSVIDWLVSYQQRRRFRPDAVGLRGAPCSTDGVWSPSVATRCSTSMIGFEWSGAPRAPPSAKQIYCDVRPLLEWLNGRVESIRSDEEFTIISRTQKVTDASNTTLMASLCKADFPPRHRTVEMACAKCLRKPRSGRRVRSTSLPTAQSRACATEL